VAGRLPVAAATESGLLRFAHLSPDSPAVDVSIQPGDQLLRDLGYGDVSGYRSLAPGTYTLAVRAAGAAITTPPVLSTRVEVRPGAARTVAATGRFDALALRVLDDDLSPPPPGQARVRVLGASTAAPLDVALAGGPDLAHRLPFPGSSGWTVVPAGPVTVRVGASGQAPAQVPLTLAPGSVSTLLALDRPGGGVTLRQILDAGAPAVVPTGPVPAGGGGTANGTGAGSAALALAGAAALIAGLCRRGTPRALLALLAVAGTLVVPALPTPAAASVRPAAGPLPVVAESAARGPAPVRLEVPAAGIDTPLPALRLDAAGTLAPPADVATAGWFGDGPAPGDVGPAVVVGHVDSTAGPGVFFRLRDLRPGDPVTVQRADGSVVHFAVTRVARYPKSAFPTAAVYGSTPDAELRLVTCGGAFDRAARSYLDNVVVYARLG
jgi:sortase (surface protein transpeptidase)